MAECDILIVLRAGEIYQNKMGRLWVAKEEISNAKDNAETE